MIIDESAFFLQKRLAFDVYTMYTHSMKTVIRTWGNSLAVRIPRAFAVHIGIAAGKEVDLLLESNGIHIVPEGHDLNMLLEQVTPENIHGETDTGSALGKEIW